MIPKTRAECLPGGPNEARPCPHTTCEWHASHVLGEKSGKHPPTESCVLDVIDRGSTTYGEIAEAIGSHRSLPQMIEEQALRRPHIAHALREWEDHVSNGRETTIERSDGIVGRSKDHVYTYDKLTSRLVMTGSPQREELRRTLDDLDAEYDGPALRDAVVERFDRLAEQAVADRAYRLYVEGPPCWKERLCVESRGHAGPCVLPKKALASPDAKG